MMFQEYNDVVTVAELCKMLRVGRSTAYQLVKNGTIESVRVGRKIRIPKKVVIAYLERQHPNEGAYSNLI